jgi:hypothetical protein
MREIETSIVQFIVQNFRMDVQKSGQAIKGNNRR